MVVKALITLRYHFFFLKYTIDEYHLSYVFLATKSKFDNHFSPIRLYSAVQEVEIFAFLQKIEKITIFRMFLIHFWIRNPKKHKNETIMPEVSDFKQTIFMVQRELPKIQKLNILSQNK